MGRARLGMMNRWWPLFATACLVCCGPDSKPRQQCAGKPDFVVTVSAPPGLLPEDTTVLVTFGGDGHESYRPNAHNERQVLFCEPTRMPGGGGEGGSTSADDQELAGAGGASNPVATISAITCELWTGGPASIRVRAGELEVEQTLTPKAETCTVWTSLVLGRDKEP
ncbi:MAG TPA: hypothetical protein VFQ35_15575 [Polyangiaceae bacterium]|nr:hypothetical protein [Polyangiaceae bacterium]